MIPPAYRKWYPPFLTLAGCFVCLCGFRSLGASYAVTRWPVIPARVVRSSVDSVSPGEFRPRIVYEFYLAGRRYLGTGIQRPSGGRDPERPATSAEGARAIAARYPVGEELLAGYDPVNLGRAVLHPRFNWWTTAPVMLGALFAALGISHWRQGRKTTSTTPGSRQ